MMEKEKGKKSSSAQETNLARWFWGGIILMAALSIVLSVAALLVQNNDLNKPKPINSVEDGTPIETITETSASELESQLNHANKAALEAVQSQIGLLLEEAYKPVYDAIPSYADFHYSVWGEYAELSEAALGKVSGTLHKMLFSGLEVRLDGVGIKLDSIFSSTFQAELNAETASRGAGKSSLGPLTKNAVEDAVKRMRVTVPISTAVALGTGVAVKAASKTIAKQIAKKLTIKAAAKTGGKWATIAAGAGGGAALCTWSGPGAGLCAAIGGVGAWIVADYGIVKLDEYWTRDEFEADLRKMVDEQKDDQRKSLEKAFAARAVAVQEMSGKIVQQHDFTLRELSGVGNGEICEIAAELTARYELMRMQLRERQPQALKELRSIMQAHAESLSLRPMVREIEQNLKNVTQVTISAAQIAGNLPVDFRADRDISGLLRLDGKSLRIARVGAFERRGFTVDLATETVFSTDQTLKYYIAIEQHLKIWGNRYFGGGGSVEILEAIDTFNGLEHSFVREFPIVHDTGAAAVDDVIVRPQTGQIVTLTLQLRAEPLANLKNAPDCS